MSTWIEIRDILDEKYQRNGFKFRGQSNAVWELQPKVCRDSHNLKEKELIKIEEAYSHDFARSAHLILPSSALPQSPGTKGRSRLAWWIYMQHYGAPTRLLDWTLSPYIATFFAVVENWDLDGAVWCFNSNSMTDVRLDDFEGSDWTNPVVENKVYHFYSQRPTDRILIQKGTFTVNRAGLISHNSDLEEFELAKIVIPAKEKLPILNVLLSMNISSNVLFPGLDGMGTELKTRYEIEMIKSAMAE